MARKRKARHVKRSILKWFILWMGKRMLGRVQKKSLRSVTDKPGTRLVRIPEGVRGVALRLPKRTRTVVAVPEVVPEPKPRRRKAGRGFAVALLSAAAVAAIKVGVDHVVENERDRDVVTPDFDVFGDDDE